MDKRDLILCALLAVAANVSAAQPSWLERVPPSAGSWQSWTEVPKDRFFEVPASKLPTAQFWLADAPYVQRDVAAYFGRPEFKCAEPLKPYLLRAAYINGGTGEFQLHWAGSSVIVSHGALGPSNPPSKTALVACLERDPTAVYSSVSTAL